MNNLGCNPRIKNPNMRKTKNPAWIILIIITATSFVQGQNFTQTIRGKIVDKETQIPLVGANIAITSTLPLICSSTDSDGDFKLEEIPVGRHAIEVSYLGYEPLQLNSILLKSGKELVLNLELIESTAQLDEVVVTAASQLDKTKPLNEFAMLSARTFSVEETARYAFSAFDPARMAQNYAGVSIGTGDDLFNEIVVRGNSPSGVLWRLEGIEIPNPNHFSSMGSSGGAISMLSSTILSNSDFYTGAFPSEFGNATSGVFDLNMRNGNNEHREFAFMLGALGIEIATEGPFKNSSKASYLLNYRYSTLSALAAIGLNPAGDVLPEYQDVSFKINVPTEKAGVFSLFGLAGKNTSTEDASRDSTDLIDGDYEPFGFVEAQTTGTIGLSHRLLLSNNSYLRTVAIASFEQTSEEEYFFDALNNAQRTIDYQDDIQNTTYRISSTYNRKLSAKNTIRAGAIFSHQQFNFYAENRHEEANQLVREFDNAGNTSLIQAFTQFKSRLNKDLSLSTGLHYSLMTLNNKMSIEPRAALQYRMNPKNTLAISLGLHSKMEHPAVYLFEGAFEDGTIIKNKKNLGLSKALHTVLSYDLVFNPNLRLKTEVYYQHLYNIPVGTDPSSTYSILNASDVWDVIELPEAVAEGTGRNIGIDMTLEKFFSNQYYFLITGSVYDSKYTPQDGNTYGTRFNGNYMLNVLSGKEFSVGNKKGKQNVFGINGKFALSGGNRFTPINLVASKEAGKTVVFPNRRFEARSGVYYRFDIGLSYRINKKRLTHTIMMDIQNVTNRANVASKFYNSSKEIIDISTQTGLFPNFNYRVEF